MIDSNIDKLLECFDSELENIARWFRISRLSLNLKKTDYRVFAFRGRKATYKELDIKIDNVKIERVNSTGLLGVIISENVLWNEHIQTVNSEISKNIGVIRRLRYMVLRSVLNNFYFLSLTILLLQYYLGLMCNYNNSQIIQKIKKIRIITNSPLNSPNPHFKYYIS